MYKSIFVIISLLLLTLTAVAQEDVSGTWQAVDDNDGKVSSLIEIKIVDGVLTGAIKKVLKEDSSTVCTECEGDKKDQPIVGMEIIWDMKPDGESWKGGKILDPENGKEYKCKMALDEDDADILEVRGFIGFSLIGRSQYWKRLK